MSSVGALFSVPALRQCQPEVREPARRQDSGASEAEIARPASSLAAMQRACASQLTSASQFARRRSSSKGSVGALLGDSRASSKEVPGRATRQRPQQPSQAEWLKLPAEMRDPQRCQEYAEDLLARLFQDEVAFRPRADYMDRQAELNGKMRSILVDWLIEVHTKYNMQYETLHLAINIMDRYLSLRTIQRKRLQLLGVVAMCIAAKFEEIDPPRTGEFAYITDYTYSKKEIVDFEARVLAVLNFDVVVPTPAHFLEAFLEANDGGSGVNRPLARYILEVALLDCKSLAFAPSMVTASAVALSNEFLGHRVAWPAEMTQRSRHSEKDLSPCMGALRQQLREHHAQTKLQVLQRKYKTDANHKAAELVARFVA